MKIRKWKKEQKRILRESWAFDKDGKPLFLIKVPRMPKCVAAKMDTLFIPMRDYELDQVVVLVLRYFGYSSP